MRRDTARDRRVAAAAIVVGWLVLLVIFGLIGAIVILSGPPVR